MIGISQGIAMKSRHDSQLALGHGGLRQLRSNAINDVCNHVPHKSTYGCAFQAEKHTGMSERFATGRIMSLTPDQKRELLRSFMRKRGLKVDPWAKKAGVTKNSLYNFLNGHSEALSLVTYSKLARAVGVPYWELSGDKPEITSPVSITVCGHVQAGDFREAVEWVPDDWYAVDVPVPERFKRFAKALEVRGSSMNREYREGAIVIWVDVHDARAPRDGDHVIVYSYGDHGLVEATVKLLREVDGRQWLWPQSDDPMHQSPIETINPPEGVREIEIVGLVIGDYRPRVI